MRTRLVIITLFFLILCSASLHAQNEKGKLGTSGAGSTSTVSSENPDVKNGVILPEMTSPKVETKKDTVYYLPFRPNVFDPLFPGDYPVFMPMIRNYSGVDSLASWGGISLNAMGTYYKHPFLLTSRSVSLGFSGHTDRLYYNVNALATNYATMPAGNFYQYGVSGIARYQLSDIVSLTAFGQWYNIDPRISMAAYPFVNTSRYGGYVTIMNDDSRVGVDLGAQRYMDPMTGRWEMAPIVTPKLRIGDNVMISLPVGGAIKNGIDRMNQKNMPPPPPPQQGKKH